MMEEQDADLSTECDCVSETDADAASCDEDDEDDDGGRESGSDVIGYCLFLLTFSLLNGYVSHRLLTKVLKRPRDLLANLTDPHAQSARLEAECGLVVASLNNTPRSDPRILLFNRPTKVGSTTLVHWLWRLSSYGRNLTDYEKVVDNDFEFFHFTDDRTNPGVDHERLVMDRE